MSGKAARGQGKVKAHVIELKTRTHDIIADEEIPFSSLLLSNQVLDGLRKSGYERPSPIQLKAIPLAKCGLDMIVQAKSGTGKTCVFTVVALESLEIRNKVTQVVILAPTREIAGQITDVVKSIGSGIPGLTCEMFIGGTSVGLDKKKLNSCHVAVGTPGRITQLIQERWLNVESVRLFVLDEADKLLEEGSFQEQINWIFSTLPENKQVLALSATYPSTMDSLLSNYMSSPVHVRLTADGLALAGVKQFFNTVEEHHLQHIVFDRKIKVLLTILEKVSFQQCLIFSNYQTRAEHLSHTLKAKGWPSAFISGSQAQQTRLKTIDNLRQFKCRILISTDLISRGIDCDKVNLVINLDLPWDTETYLHRVGRAGRYGAYALAVSLVSEGTEKRRLDKFAEEIGFKIPRLPDELGEIADILTLMQEKLAVSSNEDSSAEEASGGKEKQSLCGNVTSSQGNPIRVSPDGSQVFQGAVNESEYADRAQERDKDVDLVTVSSLHSTRNINSFNSAVNSAFDDGESTEISEQVPRGNAPLTTELIERNPDHGEFTSKNTSNSSSPSATGNHTHIHDRPSLACPFCLFGANHCCPEKDNPVIEEPHIAGEATERDHPDGCDDESRDISRPIKSDIRNSNILTLNSAVTDGDGGAVENTSTAISTKSAQEMNNAQKLPLEEATMAGFPNECCDDVSVSPDGCNNRLNPREAIHSLSSVHDSGVADCILDESAHSFNDNTKFDSEGLNAVYGERKSDCGEETLDTSKTTSLAAEEMRARETLLRISNLLNSLEMDPISSDSSERLGIDLDCEELSTEAVLPLMSKLCEEDNSNKTTQETEKTRLSSAVEFERALGRFIQSSRPAEFSDSARPSVTSPFKESESETDTSSREASKPCLVSTTAGCLRRNETDVFSSDNEESSWTESCKSTGARRKTYDGKFKARAVTVKRKALSNLALPSVFSDEGSWTGSDATSASTESSSYSDVQGSHQHNCVKAASVSSSNSGLLSDKEDTSGSIRKRTVVKENRLRSDKSSGSHLDELVLLSLKSPQPRVAVARQLYPLKPGKKSESSGLSNRAGQTTGKKFSTRPQTRATARGRLDNKEQDTNSSSQGEIWARALHPPWVFGGARASSYTDVRPRVSERVFKNWESSYVVYCQFMNSYLYWARSLRNNSKYS